MKRDPLAAWWRHEITLERYVGPGPFGDKWDEPQTILGAIDDTTRQVIDQQGVEVVSSTTVVFPHEAGFIRPGSKITLPDTHGGRTSHVIACRVADGGGMPTPDHVEVNLQ